MSDVTRILSDLEKGDPSDAEQLLPLVYEELRRLAGRRMAQEAPDHTLEATALVHEAYIRLVDVERARKGIAAATSSPPPLKPCGGFLSKARRKLRLKRGGNFRRIALEPDALDCSASPEHLVAIDDALSVLAEDDPTAAELFKLRFFAGRSVEEAAELTGVSRSTAYEHWSYAKAWLRCHINGHGGR